MTPRNPVMPTKILKEDILQVITENFMEILDMVNLNVQDALKKFQDNKNKRIREDTETKKRTHRALNKHQTETENTISRYMNQR
jgi:hypothetical protein